MAVPNDRVIYLQINPIEMYLPHLEIITKNQRDGDATVPSVHGCTRMYK
jgi:hypothetical protein